MSVSTSLKDSVFKTEVRTALGELGSKKVSDAMIEQQKKRTVKPFLARNGIDGSSDKIDNAMIFMTAEKAFKAWLKKSRVTLSDIDVTLDIKGYRKDLEEQTKTALMDLGINYSPAEGPIDFMETTDGFLSE